jgi:hypothetical protein
MGAPLHTPMLLSLSISFLSKAQITQGSLHWKVYLAFQLSLVGHKS